MESFVEKIAAIITDQTLLVAIFVVLCVLVYQNLKLPEVWYGVVRLVFILVVGVVAWYWWPVQWSLFAFSDHLYNTYPLFITFALPAFAVWALLSEDTDD